MKTKEQIRDEVISLHPYKVPGRPETYDQYNQGWEDACYTMEEKMQTFADQEAAELKERILTLEAVKETNQILIEEYRNDIKSLRSRLSDCERKRITGDRI